MKEALSESYRVFFDSAREAMYISTREGRFLEVNKAFAKFMEMPLVDLRNLRVEATLAFPTERRRFRSEIETNGMVA